MATGFEKLDRQFDRLERLFSKKKRSTAAQHSFFLESSPASSSFSYSSTYDPLAQRFPQPTFIRPTSSRMVAREEVTLASRSARRARSLPESPSTPRLIYPPTPTYEEQPIPELPDETSQRHFLRAPRTPDQVDELLKFNFPPTPRDSADIPSLHRRSRSRSKSSSRRTATSVSPKAQLNRKRYSADDQDETPMAQPQGTDVHHPSDQQEELSKSMSFERESRLSEIAPTKLATPPLSPRLIPLPEPGPDEMDNDRLKVPPSNRTLRSFKPVSDPTRASPRKSSSSSTLSTLQEPSLSDFLALSDDDIADDNAAPRLRPTVSTPPTFGLPPDPPQNTGGYPMLTLCPPLASRPATAAAFEAARIATKYQFDLVYVVNLWPSHMSRSNRSTTCDTPTATSPTRTTIPSPPLSPVSDVSGHDSSFEGRAPSPFNNNNTPRNTLTGRLLAAYGLPAIMYPFRISAPVHQKILRTQGWLEYRSDSGARDEFARGYSCSFYTGYSPARGGEAAVDPSASPDSKQRKRRAKAANRGVVFAAFRLPREDGTVVCSDAEELEALHKDAEALVDMVIDIHMTQRQKRAGAPRRCVAGAGERRLGQAKAPLVTI